MGRRQLAVCLSAAMVLGSALVTATPATAAPAPVRTAGTTSVDGSGGAWTYNAAELPEGARMVVRATYPGNGTTVVSLHLTGAEPLREYGAHAHKAACTAVSADALGHFQFVPNPNPLNPTDPAYANPTNEVWLDLHTNLAGNGHSQTTVPWQPGAARPLSVVIHEAHTSTEPGSAGTAGLRLGCLTVPF